MFKNVNLYRNVLKFIALNISNCSFISTVSENGQKSEPCFARCTRNIKGVAHLNLKGLKHKPSSQTSCEFGDFFLYVSFAFSGVCCE